MMRFGISASVLAAIIILVTGCSGSKQVEVRGDVTFDGQPIAEGSISFLPEPGTESRKASAAIVNGKYTVPAEVGPTPGKFKIEISWMKKTARQVPSLDPGILADETREAIPPKYNSASTLIHSITPGDNKLDFALTP